MSTDSVQASNGTIIPQLLLTPIGAGVGGYAIGCHAELKDVLKSDKFELSKKVTDDLKPEEKSAVQTITDELAANKKHPETAETAAKAVFKDATELPTEEFAKNSGYASLEDLVGKDGKGGKYNTAKEAVESVKSEITAAEEKLSKAADEAAKTPINEEIKALKETKLPAAEKALAEHTPAYELATNAKDGKVTKQALVDKKVAELGEASKTKISQAIETLGKKMPKKLSIFKGVAGAALGLVAGIILAKIISPSQPEA